MASTFETRPGEIWGLGFAPVDCRLWYWERQIKTDMAGSFEPRPTEYCCFSAVVMGKAVNPFFFGVVENGFLSVTHRF